MAQQVIDKHDANNPGSKNVTHKTATMRSNVKGVPVTPVMVTAQKGESKVSVTHHKLPDLRKTGTHY